MEHHACVVVGYHPPWELHGRGMKDSLRHDERVKEAVRRNLRELIGEESIITSDGTKRVRIPLKYLEQYHFRYGNPQHGGVGQGAGIPGDVLHAPGQPQPGDNQEAGDQPGEHGYDAEMSVDDLVQMMLEDLALPWLEDKAAPRQVVAEEYEFTDVRRRGSLANLDKRRTLKSNLKRNAARKQPGVHDLADDDLRFRVWDIHQELTTNAAVYFCLDISGSMTTDKKYLCRAFFWWVLRFLRRKYPHVEPVFLHHDTEAEIVDEERFFHTTAGGGTRCSSVYTVALQHIASHHPAAGWNNYLFHFSDGDNLSDDNTRCKDLIEALLRECQQVGYGEVRWDGGYQSTDSSLMTALRSIIHPRFMSTVLVKKEDVLRSLLTFLQPAVAAQAAWR